MADRFVEIRKIESEVGAQFVFDSRLTRVVGAIVNLVIIALLILVIYVTIKHS